MAEPTRYRYTMSGRRSPVHNPARSSMPVTSAGHSSYAGGDIHVEPASRHREYRSSASYPVTTTTYHVRNKPLAHTTSLRVGGRTRRAATIDACKRPIIVTTKHEASAPSCSSGTRAGSPSRDNHRSEDAAYYTQPASSVNRSRSTVRQPLSAAVDDENYRRLRDRMERPAHRHHFEPVPAPRRISTLDYGNDGYEYTSGPNDLAAYDLNTNNAHSQHRRRRDSIDRYVRPTVDVADDIGRPYDQFDRFEQIERRHRRGPPPTSRGLDRVNRAAAASVYVSPASGMPAAPTPPDSGRRGSHYEAPSSPTTDRRPASRARPDSYAVDASGGRSSYYDDSYRSRDWDLIQDSNVASRGFGLRLEPRETELARHTAESRRLDERRERRDERDSRRELDDREVRRRNEDDTVVHVWKPVRDTKDIIISADTAVAVADGDLGSDRRAHRSRRDSNESERESKKERFRDKLAAGLSLAAASIGIGTVAVKDKDLEVDGREDRATLRRRKDDEYGQRHPDDRTDGYRRTSPKAGGSPHLTPRSEFEFADYPVGSDEEVRRRRPQQRESHRDGRDGRDDIDGHDGCRSDLSASPDTKGAGEGKAGEASESRRRPRAPAAFDPTDTAALAELKAQLVEKENHKANEIPGKEALAQEPLLRRDSSPSRQKGFSSERQDVDTGAATIDSTQDLRGRELALANQEEKQVRVVSPPRDKEEKKPIKGILKQPREAFPEEPNPIREGVAPHKDDKKPGVPSGAKWTKINRQMVNPEALTVGNERFEVRDDFVIVLRVLTKEEVQAYAAATAQIREQRRKEYERAAAESDFDDEERRRRHRHHQSSRRDREPEYCAERSDRGGCDRDREREREREYRRRHHHGSDEDDEYASRTRAADFESRSHHHRLQRERERERAEKEAAL